MTDKPAKLIFVYNADSGLFNTVSDIAHKMLSPSTYSCSLCAITHGYFKENKDWAHYIQQQDFDAEFLHRDEFSRTYDIDADSYPCVYNVCDSGLVQIINAEQINRCADIDALKRLLEDNSGVDICKA